MKKIILILLLTQITATAGTSPIKFDRIDDKAWHVYAGMASAYAFGGFVYYKTHRTWISVGSAALFGGTVGVLKEAVYDGYFKMGVCSNSDAYHTFWGTAIGSMALRITIDVKQKHDIEKEYFQNLRDSMFVEKLTDFKD